MNKPWHVLRRIYVPILGGIFARITEFANKKVNRRAETFAPYYEDSLSLDVLKLRETYNLQRPVNLNDASLFLDFLIHQNHDIRLGKEGFPEEKQFDFFLILHDKGNVLLDYTYKLLCACGYCKDKIRIMEYEDKMDQIKLKENEGIVALTSRERKELLIKTYGTGHVWNCAFMERLVGSAGLQYRDIFEPVENEILVNAGSYDGRTDLEFLVWGGDKIKRIYAFEADSSNAEKCKEFIKEYCDERVVLIPKGCWNETTQLFISSGAGTPGGHLEETGENVVDVTTIDSVVNGEKVTFIKMDIEGAELNALKGAKNTIIKNRPRLAICVYHKYADIFEIPQYILSLVPEYRFYLRHYTTVEWETVLYAHCP